MYPRNKGLREIRRENFLLLGAGGDLPKVTVI